MKQPAAWIEMSSVAAGLITVMLLVMWASGRDAGCTPPVEPSRHLVLTRETDREHLASDLSSADRTARRYMRSGADQTERLSRFAGCRAQLVKQIATRHGLPPDLVRAPLTDGQ